MNPLFAQVNTAPAQVPQEETLVNEEAANRRSTAASCTIAQKPLVNEEAADRRSTAASCTIA